MDLLDLSVEKIAANVELILSAQSLILSCLGSGHLLPQPVDFFEEHSVDKITGALQLLPPLPEVFDPISKTSATAPGLSLGNDTHPISHFIGDSLADAGVQTDHVASSFDATAQTESTGELVSIEYVNSLVTQEVAEIDTLRADLRGQ